MAVGGSKELFLDRRGGRRVEFHSAVQFSPDAKRPLRLEKALSQNISLRGAQILSSVVPDQDRSFDVWIPLGEEMVVHAWARTQWTAVEGDLGDSPYWVRVGISLDFDRPEDKQAVASFLTQRMDGDRVRKEQETQKIGFIF